MLLYDRQFAPIVERLKPRLGSVERLICFESEFDDWLAKQKGWFED